MTAMSVKITYHGHACFTIRTDSTDLLIDPFLTGNEMADVKPEQLHPNYILVSHEHGDHLGDAVPIAKATGAQVISNFEIAGYMEKNEIQTNPMHIGGARQYPFGKVKLTIHW
jgi:L-ascorbate metabolism protein UlaG (beta-lactamase superfamily)